METDYIKCYGDLQQELDDAKHTLVSLNDNIRRIIGRTPKDLRTDEHTRALEGKRLNIDRQGGQKMNDPSKYKRRSYDAKSVFNRLSAPPSRSPDGETRPRLNSRIIRELPTRQEIVAAQGIDSESRARNRRMFGSLLGTLHKFCQEESRLKQREDKKAQIEKKLEEQELQEREILKKERELLFMDRKRKQLEIRRLEIKMNRLKDFEVWQSSMMHLKHRIITKTKPHIYYSPRVLCKKTEKLLAVSKSTIQNIIDKKRDAMNNEFLELENNVKIQAFENEEHVDGRDVKFDLHESTEDREISTGEEVPHCHKRKSFTKVDIISKKDTIDSKENQSKKEPSVSSSVVVVKK